MNVEPLPYSLSTSTVPFINFNKFLVIDRPSPVPSTVLLRTKSTRSNLLNNLGKSSFLIPIPVSETLKVKFINKASLFPLTSIVTLPSCVYLTALFKIFKTT